MWTRILTGTMVVLKTANGSRGITIIVIHIVIFVSIEQKRQTVAFVAIRVEVWESVRYLPEHVPRAGHVSSMR